MPNRKRARASNSCLVNGGPAGSSSSGTTGSFDHGCTARAALPDPRVSRYDAPAGAARPEEALVLSDSERRTVQELESALLSDRAFSRAVLPVVRRLGELRTT